MALLQTVERELLDHLRFIYGDDCAEDILADLEKVLERFADLTRPAHATALNQGDSILITYADQIRHPDEKPLATLHAFLKAHLTGLVSGVHILPFFPYSSDDGFSIIDYRRVNPQHGDWSDIERIAGDFRLMVDAVVNHISRKSSWFQRFLKNEAPYTDFFTVVDPDIDLSEVVRPRDLPLLTEVKTTQGARHVWTTFSEDQIDLNYSHPAVLLEIIDLLLTYIQHGAQLIRLDAIAFIWKEIGTSCIHHPRTHRIIQLIRTILDTLTPWVHMITETNVPHDENISYFGNGWNEAHLVYQFALPPLVLHTLLAGDARPLSEWAATLQPPSSGTTYFNFLASHDGIGLRPARGLLEPGQIAALEEQCIARGGGVSYRALGDGKKDPYELNITYFDALAFNGEEDGNQTWINRFLASQAIMLSLAGIPGIYFHSLVGSRNHQAGVERTGRLRSINRQHLNAKALNEGLSQPDSRVARVFEGYARLLQARAQQPAFHPQSAQLVLHVTPAVFALLRQSRDGQQMLCLHEVAGQHHQNAISISSLSSSKGIDVLHQEKVALNAIRLLPYQVRWIRLDTTP